MTWTINAATFAARDLANVIRERFNMATDRLTFQAPGRAIDAAPIFAYDQAVTVLRDGQPFFSGRAGRIPIAGSPQSENHAYEILGPWEQLERLTYQHVWKTSVAVGDPPVTTSSTYSKSRVILGQSPVGAAQTVAQVVHAVITFAQTQAGVAIQPGTIGCDIKPPWDEVVDLSCAECIRRVARWAPDCIAWLDYSATPPAFHFRSRQTLSPTTIAIPGAVASVSITKAPAHTVPAVILKFEKTNEIEGDTYESVQVIDYPPDSNEYQVGALIQTIRLAGLRLSTVFQYVQVAQLPEMPVDPELAFDATTDWGKWWLRKHGELAQYTNLSFRNLTRKVIPIADYPYELREGVIQDWMTDCPAIPGSDKTVKQAKDLITVICKFTTVVDGVVVRQGETLLTQQISVNNIPYDDAWPDEDGFQIGLRKFRRMSVSGGESIDETLAEALYDALNAPTWQGTVTTLERECTAPLGPGSLLNIEGGAAEWATMRAVVQTASDNLDTGQTTLQLGPPTHLTPQAILDLRRANRQRTPADSYAARVSGLTGDLGVIELGSTRPTFEPTSATKRLFRQVIEHDASVPNNPIILDPATNPPDAAYKVFQAMSGNVTGFDWVRAHA